MTVEGTCERPSVGIHFKFLVRASRDRVGEVGVREVVVGGVILVGDVGGWRKVSGCSADWAGDVKSSGRIF